MFSQFSVMSSLGNLLQPNKEYVNQLKTFRTLFENIKNITPGDKLGRYNGKYHINSWGKFQRWSRWWYAQDRVRTFIDLDNDFSNFFKFCDKLKDDYNNSLTKQNVPVVIGTLKLVSEIIPGLYNLKTAYSECDKNTDGYKLCVKIDSIIFTLIDFKTEISNPVRIQKKQPTDTFKITESKSD